MSGLQKSSRPVMFPMLMPESNIDEDGEYEITNVLNDTPKRVVIPLSGEVVRGAINRIQATITAKTGTNAASMNLTLLDTDNLSAAVSGVNTLFQSLSDPINGATVPDLVLANVRPDEIYFTLKGGKTGIQAVIEITGGDGTTNYTINLQVLGEAHA